MSKHKHTNKNIINTKISKKPVIENNIFNSLKDILVHGTSLPNNPLNYRNIKINKQTINI
jgi:hypothetical protein